MDIWASRRDNMVPSFQPTNVPQPAASMTDNQMGPDSMRHGKAKPLTITASPMLEIMQNVRLSDAAGIQQPPSQAGVVATFIVPGDPDTVGGVVRQVYHDLKHGNKEANIEFRETPALCVRVEAPTEEDALTLIHTAQRLAETYLSGDPTEAKLVFVEPPPCPTEKKLRIAVQSNNASNHIRPTIEGMSGTPNTASKSCRGRYEYRSSKELCNALQLAAGLHSSLALNVHLGYYLLQKYKPGQYTQEEFEDMITDSRSSGHLDTCLGKTPSEDGLSVESVMRLIHAEDSPCVPMDNQSPSSAYVTPTYVFQSCHDGDLYEVELVGYKAPAGGPSKFSLGHTKMVPQDARTARLEAVSISIGRKLDWSIVATPGDEKVRASPKVMKYLEMGHATLEGSYHDFHCYPAIHLPGDNPLGNKLKSITTKSIYRFGWKRTCYVVQFTINRRWQSIREMNRGAPGNTDFDVKVYGDNWEEDCRVQAGETVRKKWGDDLRGLLRDEVDSARGGASERVRGLIRTILDIRDFFEGASRI